MKKLILIAGLLATFGTLTACTPPPPGPRGIVRYVPPPGALPGPRYEWVYGPGRGWGWWHPQNGWYRQP